MLSGKIAQRCQIMMSIAPSPIIAIALSPQGSVRQPGKTKENSIPIQEKLDKVLMNRYAALPIFFFFMFVIYYVSITLVGDITIGAIEWFINDVLMVAVSSGLGSLGAGLDHRSD